MKLAAGKVLVCENIDVSGGELYLSQRTSKGSEPAKPKSVSFPGKKGSVLSSKK